VEQSTQIHHNLEKGSSNMARAPSLSHGKRRCRLFKNTVELAKLWKAHSQLVLLANGSEFQELAIIAG
jgi:hypothetical protein